MYKQLFTQLVLTNSPSTALTEVSQPVPTQGANSAQIDFVVWALTATKVVLTLEESNDMQTWKVKGSPSADVSTIGNTLVAKETGIASAYVRVRATLTGTGAGIISAGVNLGIAT